MHLTVLNSYNPTQSFPDIATALIDPDGLLAMGGCLSPERLLNAYKHGIFPWYNPDDPILWWSPNPRLVLFPNNLIVSHSLQKTLRKEIFKVTFDKAFDTVMKACAQPRADGAGTWISPEMNAAYNELHRLGYAHSVETWLGDELVGGLYGVCIGQVFFGESMFHTQTNASKVAFVALVTRLKLWHYQLIDCQVHSKHLVSLGAENIARADFAHLLDKYCKAPVHTLAWRS
jgi:leucyl/phenylalanyl-tRNA--protein transferase